MLRGSRKEQIQYRFPFAAMKIFIKPRHRERITPSGEVSA